MAVQLVPVLAIAFVAAHLRMKKRRPKSKAVVVIQGATTDSVSLKIGERLSVQFLESSGEDWKMIDPPDGYLMGTAKLKWKPVPGEKMLKAFDFSARRAGKTKAEFIKYVEGASADRSKIEILVT